MGTHETERLKRGTFTYRLPIRDDNDESFVKDYRKVLKLLIFETLNQHILDKNDWILCFDEDPIKTIKATNESQMPYRDYKFNYIYMDDVFMMNVKGGITEKFKKLEKDYKESQRENEELRKRNNEHNAKDKRIAELEEALEKINDLATTLGYRPSDRCRFIVNKINDLLSKQKGGE